jgi:hypothetical protein
VACIPIASILVYQRGIASEAALAEGLLAAEKEALDKNR